MTQELRALRVGDPVAFADTVAKLIGTSHDPSGRIEALLDYGDHVERVKWADLIRKAEPAPALQDLPYQHSRQDPMLAELTERERSQIEDTARHVLQVLTGSKTGSPEQDRAAGRLDPQYDPDSTTLAERVSTKSAEMARLGRRGFSRARLYDKLARYQERGISGLIHGSKVTVADRLAAYDEDVVDAVRRIARREKKLAKRSTRALVTVTRSELDKLGLAQDLSRYQLAFLVGECTRGGGLQYDSAGRHRHDIKPVRVYGRIPASVPGEIVQIDATRLNVHLEGPDGTWAVGHVLTAIDVASRVIAALRVIVGAVSGRDVGLLLWDMLQPHVLRQGYPYELELHGGQPRKVYVNIDGASELPTFQPERHIGERMTVWPATIVLDRGTENISSEVLAIATAAGIDITLTPPGAGYAKGIVEAIQNAHDYVQSLFDSYKGATATNHPRGIESMTEFRRGDLEDLFWEWIIGVYHNRPHAELVAQYGPDGPATPAQVYYAHIRNGGVIEQSVDPYQYITFLQSGRARVADYGLRANRRVYNSPDVTALRQYLQAGEGAKARDLHIRFDPYDVTRVFARHPVHGHWLCIPLVSHDRGTRAPYSDLARESAIEDARNAAQALRPEDIFRREAAIRTRWTSGGFVDARDRRRAAREAARQEMLASDLATAGDEFLSFAYPPPHVEEAPMFPADQDEDDITFDYEDIDAEVLDL